MNQHLADTDARKAALALDEARAAADEALAVYARCKSRVDAFKGPLREQFLEQHTKAWTASTMKLHRAAWVLRMARIEDYLARRRARAERGQF